ncbi:MAG: DUF928 domain-containing protein [Coleofasciculus sp. S288]|nr:DUF928 domain-containing protein [Coleofasciculus sp. S288]
MAWFKKLSRYTLLTILLAVILTLGIAVNTPVKVQAQTGFESLSSKIPEQWEFEEATRSGAFVPMYMQGGDARCNCIQDSERSLVALVPASGIGTTMAEYPTFVWYVPRSTAPTVEFVLRDASNEKIYSLKYALTQEGGASAHGLMSLTLPASANISPLEIGQDYRWELVLVCSLEDHSSDVISEGGIRRVQPDSTLVSRIQQVTSPERVALYADARLWYDTLATLMELRRDHPNDKSLAEAWNKLLNSVGLGVISDKRTN